MYIQNNSVNFTSRIDPSEPLKNAFDRFASEKNYLYRRRFVNYVNALINDGKSDIIEIKEVDGPNGKMIRGFINKEGSYSFTIDESNTWRTQTDCVANVIESLARKRNYIGKFQKFGFKKLRELHEIIFNNK